MSKKTSTKSKPAKATKKAKAPEAKVAPGECPKGGKHEWTEEGTETFCGKCKEPKAKAGKAKAKAAGAKAKATPASDKKVSALNAAAQVLQSSKDPLNTKAMIELMATKGLWTSPGGKTPHATLYSAIIREISVKGRNPGSRRRIGVASRSTGRSVRFRRR